jgi:RNA-directed DNA polymerase
MEGRGDLTMASISLQDLRRRLYDEAKAEKTKRFWGLYVHVAKLETLRLAYDLAKRNNGAPGIDGVTFDAIEVGGLEAFLAERFAQAGSLADSRCSATISCALPARTAQQALG